MELSFKSDLDTLVKQANIADLMGEDDLQKIGLNCLALYKADRASRSGWEDAYAKALKKALQVKEEKNFPWPKCSNVKFPLVTVGALNFHALAYPALINGREVVKCALFGKQEDDPEVTARAARVQGHMNYQLLEEMNWEADTDRALLIHPILGCHFKKVNRDFVTGKPYSRLVMAEHLVVNYWTTCLSDTRVISEIVDIYANDYETCVRRGLYRKIDLIATAAEAQQTSIDAVREQTQRITRSRPTEAVSPSSSVEANDKDDDNEPSSVIPYRFVEQLRWMDLDGDDYEEPYIVTFDESQGRVVRIVANWLPSKVEKKGGTVIRIESIVYYEKIPFIPSPDGGFYDIGFGQLLDSIGDSVDSLINQLIDAGTMNNLQSGFLGRGARIRGGQTSFSPGEWKRVDSTGDDLQKSVVPLPSKEPSKVLMDLLFFLINWSEKIAQATEGQMGEMPGQNTPAEVMRVADSNGRRIFNAIFKRMWRAFKCEFKLLRDLNARSNASVSESGRLFDIGPDDYLLGDLSIVPAADDEVVTSAEQERQSLIILQTSQQIPGHNMYEVGKRIYRAHKVRDVDAILPDPKGPDAIPQQPDPKVIKAQSDADFKQTQAQEIMARLQMDAAELQSTLQQNEASLMEILANAQKLKAEADSAPVNHLIALIDAQIGAAKHQDEKVMRGVEMMLNHISDMDKNDAQRQRAKSSGKAVG